MCIDGARAAHAALQNTDPTARIRTAIVWVGRLPLDSQRSAEKARRLFAERDAVEHFFDAEEWLGQALSRQRDWEGTAWDIYLFYPAEASWDTDLPPSGFYTHQMSALENDGHFATGPDLVRAIERGAQQTLGR